MQFIDNAQTETKMKSEHAQAAAMIRAEMKKMGINGKVRSESYSGGTSIRIAVENLSPVKAQKLEEFASQFQYGHFDGMTDMYEYSNSRKDLPQVKFVFVENRPSDELRQMIWDFARKYFGFDAAPESAKNAGSFYVWNGYGDQLIWRLFSGAEKAFWTSRALAN